MAGRAKGMEVGRIAGCLIQEFKDWEGEEQGVGADAAGLEGCMNCTAWLIWGKDESKLILGFWDPGVPNTLTRTETWGTRAGWEQTASQVFDIWNAVFVSVTSHLPVSPVSGQSFTMTPSVWHRVGPQNAWWMNRHHIFFSLYPFCFNLGSYYFLLKNSNWGQPQLILLSLCELEQGALSQSMNKKREPLWVWMQPFTQGLGCRAHLCGKIKTLFL